MIVMGSVAARLQGVDLKREPKDVDICGTREELDEFWQTNSDAFTSVKQIGGREAFHFILNRERHPFDRIEFRVSGQHKADDVLLSIDFPATTKILKSDAYLASINILCLMKQSHLAQPRAGWEKHLFDLIQLRRHTTRFTNDEVEYYRVSKIEADARFRHMLPLEGDDRLSIFERYGHFSRYQHEDVLRAVAIDYPSSAMIFDRSASEKQHVFEDAPYESRLAIIQQEAMAVGIQRGFMQDRTATKALVYRGGLVITVRDLCPPWLQEFCFDNISALIKVPEHPFLQQFQRAESQGKLRSVPAAEQGSDYHLRLAERHFRWNRLRQTGTECREVLSSAPENARAHYLLGVSAFRLAATETAKEPLQKAVQYDPKNGDAWDQLGRLYLEYADLKRAIECFRTAVKLRPRSTEPLMTLGETLRRAGRSQEAAVCFRQALRIAPNDAIIRNRLAATVRAKGAATR